MHQVAQRCLDNAAYDMSSNYLLSTILIAANTFDTELISSALLSGNSIELQAAISDPEYGLMRCRRLHPELLIVDPKIDENIVSRCSELLRERIVKHVLVLDDRLHESRLTSLLAVPAFSYFTRQVNSKTLQDGIHQIARTGERAFDPDLVERLQRDGKVLRLAPSSKPNSVATLTSRELEVMKLLASGYSVRKCAEFLNLAESTVDNHKSRLMKKLDIHKIVELTHMAIREGLIVV